MPAGWCHKNSDQPGQPGHPLTAAASYLPGRTYEPIVPSYPSTGRPAESPRSRSSPCPSTEELLGGPRERDDRTPAADDHSCPDDRHHPGRCRVRQRGCAVQPGREHRNRNPHAGGRRHTGATGPARLPRARQQACCRRDADQGAGPVGTARLDGRNRPLPEQRPEARCPGQCPGPAHVLLLGGPRPPGRSGHPRVAAGPERQLRDIVQGPSASADDGPGTCAADAGSDANADDDVAVLARAATPAMTWSAAARADAMQAGMPMPS